MNDHERALMLAAAAIDFTLTPAEVDALDAHLRTCAACRTTAARLQGDAARIAALPLRRPSDAVGRRIVEAAQRPRAVTYRRTLVLVGIALLLAVGLVGAALAGASLLRSPELPLLLVLPSPASTAISTTLRTPDASDASPTPQRVAQRTFQTSCGPVTPQAADAAILPVLPPDSTASVLVDGLRIRSAPLVDDCSELFQPLLQGSEQVFVVAGPVVASGYDWYRVEPIGGRGESRPGGWIARSSREGDPWVASAEPSCPTLEPSPSALALLNFGFILACLGDRDVRFDARLVPCRCDVDYGQWRISGFVADLQPPSPVQMMDPDDPAAAPLPMNLVSGASAPDPLPSDAVVTVVGHYDDPASTDCTWTSSKDGVPLEDPILACRTAFVVTQVVP